MFEPANRINDWQNIDYAKKQSILKKFISSDELISDILLRDRLTPFWGLIEGKLRDKYEKVHARLEDNELIVFCEDSNMKYYFEEKC